MRSISFTIEFGSTPLPFKSPSMDERLIFDWSFSEEEIVKIKKLIKESSFDKREGLMPILEMGDKRLYDEMEEKIQFSIRGYFKHKEEGTLLEYLNGDVDYEEFLDGDYRDTYDYICHILESLFV